MQGGRQAEGEGGGRVGCLGFGCLGVAGEQGGLQIMKYADFICFINITWLGKSVIGFNIVDSSLP
jgi:hypothetical protein